MQPVIEPIVVTGSRISRRDYQSKKPNTDPSRDASTNRCLLCGGTAHVDRAIFELSAVLRAAHGMSEVGDVQGLDGLFRRTGYGDLRGLGPNGAGPHPPPDGRPATISSNPTGPWISIDSHVDDRNVEVITGGARRPTVSDAIACCIEKLQVCAALQRRRGESSALRDHPRRWARRRACHRSARGNLRRGPRPMVWRSSTPNEAWSTEPDRPFFFDEHTPNSRGRPRGIIQAGSSARHRRSRVTRARRLTRARHPSPVRAPTTARWSQPAGTIFTDLASPTVCSNYRGLGQLKGVNISHDCTNVQVGLGQYRISVPLTSTTVRAQHLQDQ